MSKGGKQLAPYVGENMDGKILKDFFITPAQEKYQGRTCWRLCGANKADHFHVLWGFLSISLYQQELKKCMETTLKVKLPLTFKVLQLRKMNMGLKTFGDKCMCWIMLTAG